MLFQFGCLPPVLQRRLSHILRERHFKMAARDSKALFAGRSYHSRWHTVRPAKQRSGPGRTRQVQRETRSGNNGAATGKDHRVGDVHRVFGNEEPKR